MEISITGIKLIEFYEGNKFKSYKCPAGVWTIGIGTTKINGVPVKEGQTCTKEQAYDYLREHLKEEVYPTLEKIKVELNQNQFDALCSFIYNVGNGAFEKSTLLKLLNKGDFDGVAKEFSKWTRAGGKTLAGLVKRRKSEKELFTSYANK